MKKLLTAVCLTVTAGLAVPAVAQERGSAEEAIALVKKAAAYLQVNGKDKAIVAFSDANGGFQTKDLYVFLEDSAGITLAHTNPRLIGKEIRAHKDADGKVFGEEIMNTCLTKGSGWVDYKWSHPTTKKIEQKSTYVEKAGDFCIAVGIYKG